MRVFNLAKPVSNMALAIALATGAAAVGTVGFADTAHAQKKKKEEKPEYSNEFIAAYSPINEAVSAEGADITALRPQIDALLPLVQSNDEKNAAGGLVFNAGIKGQDQTLQLQGMELMLASGKTALDQIGRFNFIAYQLSNAQNDYPKARTYLQRAIDYNFSTDSVSAADMQIAMAENYFAENRFREGLAYLSAAIDERNMARQSIDENWYRRGLTVAYNNEIVPEVYDFLIGWIGDYASPTNWRDAINLTRNLNEYEQQEMLDLMRLGNRVEALTDKQDYIIYVEAADARRLPKEVKDIIEAGYASGDVSRDDIYLADALTTATDRIEADRADLPALEADAGAADSGLRTVMAAADAFLSYGEYAKAERFYAKGLGMPGVNTAQALTRLGIAQTEQGKTSEAQATLSKIEGARMPIAKLWIAYAAEKAAMAAGAAPNPLISS